jgi:hypothetical protein
LLRRRTRPGPAPASAHRAADRDRPKKERQSSRDVHHLYAKTISTYIFRLVPNGTEIAIALYHD